MAKIETSNFNQLLTQAAQTWSSDDPDPVTREELAKWLASSDPASSADFADAFGAELVFGTAGLRGLLGPGPNRMNRLVVARATHGLLAYLAQHVEGAKDRGICVGFDGRRMSREFANDVVRLALGFGFQVFAFENVAPTPLVAFAAKEKKCAGAVIITASHNPPAYNGYKVYFENAAQIVPPQDEGIAAEIKKAPLFSAMTFGDIGDATISGRYHAVDAQMRDAYHAAVAELLPKADSQNLSIVYTAMHGVGRIDCERTLREAGFQNVHIVKEQAEPDGAFPTVAFPNPEEKGAMDLSLALAKDVNADLVIANDPDADRLAIAIPQRAGGYRMLTGNEVGCILADWLMRNWHQQEKSGVHTNKRPLLLQSIVSSPMLKVIAQKYEARFEQTLTGFKWIANRGLELAAECTPVLGYEEALGYSVGALVRDKDGVSAARAFAQLAAEAKRNGQTVEDALDDLFVRFGVFVSIGVSITRPGLLGIAEIKSAMETARKNPFAAIDGNKVVGRQDLLFGVAVDEAGNLSQLSGPASDVLSFDLEGGHRVMLRPSGTEPKLKCYVDVRADVAGPNDLEAARAKAHELADKLAKAALGSLAFA